MTQQAQEIVSPEQATATASNQIFEATQEHDKKKVYLSGGLMVPNAGPIEVKGTTLSQLTGGNIKSIQSVQDFGAIYQYRIVVNGGGHVHILFRDVTNDEYKLYIENPVGYNHTLDYNSSGPEINYIEINNL